MPIYNLTEAVNGPGIAYSGVSSWTGTGVQSVVAETVADSAVDAQIDIAYPVANLQLQYILSTQDIALAVNDTSGGVPAVTIPLKANVSYIWTPSSYNANLITVPVTAMYATNSSGSDATLNIVAVYDATP